MSDEWDFYFARLNDAVASIFVDLGIRADVPNDKRPWLLCVWVPLQAPKPDGLASQEEAPRLHALGEALDSTVSATCGAQLVARVTGAGRREFYFYAAEPGELVAAANSALKGFPEYRHESSSSFQPDWDQYQMFYPSGTNLQRMFNRRVLESLADSGDVHEQPRQVDHWLEFCSEQARDACRETLLAIDFKLEEEFLCEDPPDEFTHGLVVSRVDSVDTHSINGVTLELARLAEEYGGRYEGWECQVVAAEVAAKT